MKTQLMISIDYDLKQLVLDKYPNKVSKLVGDLLKDHLLIGEKQEEETLQTIDVEIKRLESKKQRIEKVKQEKEEMQLKSHLADDEINWIHTAGKNIYNNHGHNLMKSLRDFREQKNRPDFPKDRYIEELKRAGVEVEE